MERGAASSVKVQDFKKDAALTFNSCQRFPEGKLSSFFLLQESLGLAAADGASFPTATGQSPTSTASGPWVWSNTSDAAIASAADALHSVSQLMVYVPTLTSGDSNTAIAAGSAIATSATVALHYALSSLFWALVHLKGVAPILKCKVEAVAQARRIVHTL